MSEFNPMDYTTWSDQALINGIELQESWITGLEKEIITRNNTKAIYQAELDHRRLKPFWEDNPGLQFDIGDPLLITEFASHSEIRMDWHIGETCTVANVNAMNAGNVYISGDGFGIPITLELARQMRRAWLAAQQETP